MAISAREAKEALDEITRTSRHSSQLHAYKSAAPHLVLWGVLWLLGYGATYLVARQAGWVWLAVLVIGGLGSFSSGIAAKPAARPRFSWQIFFTWLAVLGAIASVLAIFAPIRGAQVGALFPLVAGWAYVVLGLWLGTRLILAGSVVVGLTLFGFFALPSGEFMLWMAGVGSLTLIGTGLWLRTV